MRYEDFTFGVSRLDLDGAQWQEQAFLDAIDDDEADPIRRTG